MIKGGFPHNSNLYEYSRLFNGKRCATPESLIEFAESVMPEDCKGQFVYNKNDKSLLSLSPHLCSIYFDPLHGVLELNYKTTLEWEKVKSHHESEMGVSYEEWQQKMRELYESN